jgi:hypothetical protein
VVARGAREGDGDPCPGWHEAAEGLGWPGVGGVSSMKRCLRCRGEGNRRAVSVVWRGGAGGPFYMGGEAMVGRGDGRLGGDGAVSRRG